MDDGLRSRIISELDEMHKNSDQEICHSRADELLLRALLALNERALVAAYDGAKARVGFWYA